MPAVVRTFVLTLALTVAAPTTAASASSHRVSKAQPLGQRVVAEAAAHLGAPYVFGAAGPRAFDCSGLVQYAFHKVGVSLPHSASAQYGSVRHVPQSQRRVGDLIFFRLGGGGVDHVGIYAGNNQIVVAPKTGDHVRYEKIWTSAYSVGRVG
jgi:cell wall-associated NlpC family hydrolase